MSTYNWLGIASKLLMLFIIFAVAYLVDYMVKNEIIQKQYSKMQGRGKQFLTENMRRAKGKAFNYDYMDAFINKYGVNFMIKGITPVGYVALKLIASLFVMVVTMYENVVLGLAFGPACYYILDFIFIESNKSDNKLMLEDIKNVYDTLRIQIKAGVYITSVLTDCYLVVKNKRLKKAFLELTSDIAAKNDLEESLDRFTYKFDNQYIDNLATVIKQSMTTGQAGKMFDDIKGQINDIENAMVEAEKQKINTQIIIVQALMYVAILVSTVYLCLGQLGAGLSI